MDKTAKVINCGPLKDDRMLCGTITVGGEFTNRIDRPQQIYNINNNGKMYLFEQYGVPCHLLEYIGIYLTEPLQSSAPPPNHHVFARYKRSKVSTHTYVHKRISNIRKKYILAV